MSLKTTFGPIRILLPENAGYSVEARTSFGKIKSELPLMSSGSLTSESLSAGSATASAR